MHLPTEAIEAAHRAHVAAHGPDCGRGPGGGVAGPKSACMIVFRAWLVAQRERERDRRTTLRERNEYIVSAFWAGVLLKDIGSQVGLSTPRTAQVLKEYGINVRAERVRQRAENPTPKKPRVRSTESRRSERLHRQEKIRAYDQRPEVKARKQARMRAYRDANRDRLNAYDRAYREARRVGT